MSKTIKMMRLDLLSIKPYLTWKSMLMVLAVAVFLNFTVESSAPMVIAMIMMYAVTFGSYPFVVSDKVNLDMLYGTLSLSRRKVVTGRYLFVGCLNLVAAVIGIVVSLLPSLLSGIAYDIPLSLGVACACYVLYGLLQCIQLPIYFSRGYAKGKMAAYLPLLAIPLFVLLLSNGLDSAAGRSMITWVGENAILFAALVVAVFIVGVLVSHGVSQRLYQKRDF